MVLFGLHELCSYPIIIGVEVVLKSWPGQWPEAEALRWVHLEMKLIECLVDHGIYGRFCKVGRTLDADDLLVEMMKYGISPDCISYSTLNI